MKVADILASVRDVLQDLEGVRYKDDSLLRGLSMAVYDLRRARPDYFIGTFDTVLQPVRSIDEELPLPAELLPSFVKYVAGWAEMRDDEYTADGRAASLMQAFSVDIGAT